ncbi:hypothetical protein GYMLUDRAFT_903143 [Collybiopsis luxurians FD-317 M1]|uniref:RCC1/BLIP-II protein n=1 Tax=Collybiopsis luxurians FD-317 M1 TaxID=944289 RepID=A0A0D0C9D7_9AGAR|nr:hypothetical protein GYMLUDRAFT_903143 [Collybiopsis luxurians FD-317 M1]
MPCSLLSSGSNAHGQLANATIDDAHTFTRCLFDYETSRTSTISEEIVHIASGANHTLLLTESSSGRTIWGCGDGSSGQLGNRGHDGDEMMFRRIDLRLSEHGFEGYNPRLICSGWETSYIILSCEGGTEKQDVLISMGRNDFGDLGVGPTVRANATLFHQVQFDHLRVGGLPLDVGSLKVLSIAAGQHHVLVQFQGRFGDGEQTVLVGWGAARHGQLGDTSSLTKKTPFFSLPRIVETSYADDPVISFAPGNQHSVFRHQSGRLSSLGSNRKSQTTGLDVFLDVSFVGCTWNGTYWVDHANGSRALYATGSHAKGQLGRPSLLDSASSIKPGHVELPFDITMPLGLKIACGSEHVLALRKNCVPVEVWGWGWNEHGNLGLGSTDDVFVPTKLWPLEVQERHETNDGPDKDRAAGTVTGVWAGCGTSWIAIRE